MPRKPLLVALGCALLGLVLLELYMRSFEARATGGAKIALVVVTADLPAGAALDRKKLSVRAVPEAYVEPRQVRDADLDRVLGTRLAVAQQAGNVLLWPDLAGLSTRRRALSELVSEGLRAYTLHGDHEAFAGLLEPGDRVDVLEAGGASEPVLENAVVLAVGERIDSEAPAVDAAPPRSRRESAVTLRVSVDQARRLTLAEQRGELRLLLRNPDDAATTAANLAGARR